MSKTLRSMFKRSSSTTLPASGLPKTTTSTQDQVKQAKWPPLAPTAEHDAPPAYSASAAHTTSPEARITSPEAQIATLPDDRYDYLKKFDTIFLIDDSLSMSGPKWSDARAAVAAIAPICTKYDDDGIDLYFLNFKKCFKYIKDSTDVDTAFKKATPNGGTPTGARLKDILEPYLSAYKDNPGSHKPLNLIVITDGVATDDPEDVIVDVAKRLDDLGAPTWQVGIQFFQVGCDRRAADSLRELDDELKKTHGCRDIVDTVPWTGQGSGELDADGILKVVLGSVVKKWDRKDIRP